MRWFANLKTAYKLGLGFGLCIGLTLIVGWASLSHIAELSNMSSLQSTDVQAIMLIGDLNANILRFAKVEKNHILADTAEERIGYEQSASGFDTDIQNNLKDLKGLIYSEQAKKMLAAVEEIWPQYLANYQAIIKLSRENKRDEAQKLSHSMGRPLLDKIDSSLTEFETFKRTQVAERNKERDAIVASAHITVNALLVMAMLVGILSGRFITRLITRSLAEIGKAARGLAVGDIEQQITIQTRDEVGQVAEEFRTLIAYQREMAEVANTIAEGDLTSSVQPKSDRDMLGNAFVSMITNLRDLIGRVAESADSVAATSTQLSVSAEQTGKASTEIARSMQEVACAADQSATTSQEMAKGSEQQARSASEAAAEMHQLHAAVKQVKAGGQQQQQAAQQANAGMQQAAKAVEEVARSSQQMAVAARQATDVAQSGGKAVEQTVASMARIKHQVQTSAQKVTELGEMGKSIGAIVETIDQIAEQTNLLALNAAIEAARAGENGRGFAVVADEVRKLAERSTIATSEVSTLIGKVRKGVDEAVQAINVSTREVAEGAAKSHEAGRALTQILQAAQTVATQVENVSAIAEQMAASVEEVTATVDTVSRSAQQNERTVEAMADGAERVSSAIALVAAVSQETAAGAEEMSASAEEVSASAQNVSAAVEEQTASVEKVKDSASELSSMSARLQELVSQFKLETEITSKKPALRMIGRKAA